MIFKDYLKESAQEIEIELDRTLSQFLKETKKTNIKLLPFAKGLVNSCKGGKRIRGVLCNLGYEIASAKFKVQSEKRNKNIIQVGAAFEILHSSLLIHDDIIDQSPERRGQPSLYMALGGKHYGISQAISLGDIGLYLPIKIISKTKFSDEIKIRVLNYFSQMLINTGWGQIMDVKMSPVDSSSKDKDINFINLYKTAKYTIAGPLQIGAILAGADNNLIKNLGEFGENAGIAFQIHDDTLDGESGVIELAQAAAYVSEAKKIIPKITKKREMAIMLEEMTKYLVERTK